MQPRIKHPAFALPNAMAALQALGKAAHQPGLAPSTLHLVSLRASQINGCSVCIEMHARDLRKAGETDQRLFGVAAWRDAPYFSDAERSALALTEVMTRMADQSDPVPDAVWAEAARHFDEPALAALTLHIAQINLWNRLNVSTRQLAGSA
jgi:AhpD family alkylhydroperoxidase